MSEYPRIDTHGHDDPPTAWCDWWTGLTGLTNEIFYGWPDNDVAPNPWFWHWCAPREIWVGASTADHTLVEREPLHLEASLLWPCCGTHGFARGGTWQPA